MSYKLCTERHGHVTCGLLQNKTNHACPICVPGCHRMASSGCVCCSHADDTVGVSVQVGGTFWLTRLARDREAAVQAAALSLLAHLASPGAPLTRRMLLQGWPEAGTAVLKVHKPYVPASVKAQCCCSVRCQNDRAGAAMHFLPS